MPLVNHDHMVKTYMDPASAQGCLSMLKIGCSHVLWLQPTDAVLVRP